MSNEKNSKSQSIKIIKCPDNQMPCSYGPPSPTEESQCCEFAATIFFVLVILFFVDFFEDVNHA